MRLLLRLPLLPLFARCSRALLALSALMLPVQLFAQAGAAPRDILVPVSSPEQAIVGPLAVVTVLSGDASATRRFYAGAMDMASRSTALQGAEAAAFAASLGLPSTQNLNVTVYFRPGLADAVQIRVVDVPAITPPARPEHDAQVMGPLSLGFPVYKLQDRAAKVSALGWPATAGVTAITLPRGDGATYSVKEAHFQAPDGVLGLGIDRGELRPVGPIDPALDIGGPAYSGVIVSDSKAMEGFLDKVLGFEKRRDTVLTSSGPAGGLGLPAGTQFTFQQWFAPGASTGYLVVMQYLNAGRPAHQGFGKGARGMAAWGFETRDLALVLTRARAHNATVLSPIAPRLVPGLGMRRTLVLATPDGLPIELMEASR
jgi:catechol 2,3-dioxygenase-like lactoylglutathione lyase family enzyme